MSLPINTEDLLNPGRVEWQRLEFKKGWNPTDILHTICAFANDFNNWNGGYIIVGIEEKDNIASLPPVGIKENQVDKIQKELLNYCSRLRPQYFPQYEPRNIDNKTILLIWADGGSNRPYKAPKSLAKDEKVYLTYIRKGSSTVIASLDEERELLSTGKIIPFDDRINHKSTLSDIKLHLIKSHLTEYGSELLNDASQMPFENLCRKMNLVEGPDEYLLPKNVGLLMFNDDPTFFFPSARVDIVQYGDESGTILKEKTFKGPIQQQIRDALNYINNNIIIAFVIKVTGTEISERFFNYPFNAIEEALVNAFYHQDYSEDSFIEIGIHANKIEIISYPGPLLPIDKDNINNPPSARKYRNRRIGDLLKDLKLTEERGTGYKTIKSALDRNGSPEPEFETDENRTYYLARFLIHPGAATDAAQALAQAKAQAKAQAEAQALAQAAIIYQILNLLKEGPLKRKDIAIKLNLSTRAGNLIRALDEVNTKKMVRYSLPDKPTSPLQKYKITKKGLNYIKQINEKHN